MKTRTQTPVTGPAPPKARGAVRRGATTLEVGLVMGCWIVVFAGIFDAGISTMRHNTVAHIARQATRMAIVRGSQAGPELTPWGPTTQEVNLGGTSAIAQAMANHTGGLPPSIITLKLEWLDGNNDPDSRVRATVTASYQPVVTMAMGSHTITMQSRSTMPIAH